MLTTPLIERALRVAALAHQGQTRKASDLPYFLHPAAVALILSRCGFESDEILAAAILHDVLEDTEWTPASLAEEFPLDVVRIVEGASEQKADSTGESRPWAVRKAEHVEAIESAGFEVAAVVLADKLHNLTSMLCDLESGEELWSRFNAPRDAVIAYHRDIVRAACRHDSRHRKLAEECQATLQLIGAH